MKNAIILLAMLTLFCFIFTGCGESELNDVVLESRAAPPEITVTHGAFDVDVNECIQILNEDIKNENLQTLSSDYDTVSDGSITIYRSQIDKNLELRLFAYKETENRITTIQLLRIDDIDASTTNDPKMSEDESKKTLSYFKIITKNVDPRFNVEPFLRTGSEGLSDYDLDGIHYTYFSYQQDLGDGNPEQVLRQYYVTTNKALYDQDPDARDDLDTELLNLRTKN